ncbi:MAG: adenosylmethionine decarboxylase [bacterium]|nr:adenosylmethionine decarboxylase [bacterium]
MNALGRQILVEYYDCDAKALNDCNLVASAMLEAARLSGATVVEEVFHLFNPHGISGVVVIAESHLSIHTWPEYGYAAVDLFTCGDEIQPEKAFEHLKKLLHARSVSVMELKRGVLEVHGRPLTHKPPMMKATLGISA